MNWSLGFAPDVVVLLKQADDVYGVQVPQTDRVERCTAQEGGGGCTPYSMGRPGVGWDGLEC